MKIAQKVMDEVEVVGFSPKVADNMCRQYQGYLVYFNEKGGKIPSGDFVWKIFRFTDGSLIYLDLRGISVQDEESMILEQDNPTWEPIRVTA